ncbi:unnamed protein product, partial [Cladocopium goreaui]
VDTMMHNLSLPKVDILIVDTEGADPAVLRGAGDALRSVRYLMFETHRENMSVSILGDDEDLKGTAWSKETIHSVVSNLNSRGFDCYWAGANGNLASITWCYHTSFEKVRWGNIACVKRGDVWWQVMEGFDPNARFTTSPQDKPLEAPTQAPTEAPTEEPMPKVQPEEALFWPEFTLQTTVGPFNATVIDSKAINNGAFVQLPGVQKRCADPRNRRIKGCKYPRERALGTVDLVNGGELGCRYASLEMVQTMVPDPFCEMKRKEQSMLVLLLNLHFWLLIPTLLHHRSGESIVSGAEEPANPLSLIDSAAVGAAFSDVAVVSAETVTVTTMPASTSETEAPPAMLPPAPPSCRHSLQRRCA